MKIVYPKEHIKISLNENGNKLEYVFKKKSIYIMSDIIAFQLRTVFAQKKYDFDAYFKVFNVDNYYERFNVNNSKNIARVVIIRTGGIGDLIALSSITKFVYDNFSKNIVWITQSKYFDVFAWYKVPVKTVISFFDSVESNVDFLKLKKGNSSSKLIFFEGIIETSKDNWYELQFQTIGMKKEDFDKNFGRPQLHIPEKFKKVKSRNIDATKKSILINPRSTSRIRTMPFKDIYTALLEVIKDDPNYNIYIHKYNIVSQLDFAAIENIMQKDKRVKLIEAKNLHEFFIDAKDADYTVSVDTALIHFREGIEKPGLGIYAAFPTEARTKYYQYTKSIDVKFNCTQQPCFIHTKRPDEHCMYAMGKLKNGEWSIEDYAYAPCIYSKSNPELINQLTEGLKDLLSV